ncbi:hypothetical protein GHK92_04730 [Nocardioides sp. dk4132]|uniref:hypothetical protein n=1 Tax=unclassified Nocardioides TaxID=2615069 RepID=UPI001294D9BB|nr:MULTISPECIES: hypothetical protein [unclassified Nocardioides]MQW75170.1 hypothetical protein [Nocardioides sp. dk4132]QGA07671.1 hypothetical protein GFH29_09875 [Nocardioides sp. dk884]
MSAGPAPLSDVDPFDLPDWLGTGEVTWTSRSGLRAGHLVAGVLHPGEAAVDADAYAVACDLLAVDAAYPVPVVGEPDRTRTHQAWHRGEVHLVEHEARLTLAIPGTGFDADLVLDALGRLARAVGASPERYSACLRIGGGPRRTP